MHRPDVPEPLCPKDGRRISVDSANDEFTGALNKQSTNAAVQKDFATAGSFSLEDSFGATVLAVNPQVPNVAESLSATANALPNTFNPNPPAGGYYLGPLAYFHKKCPSDVPHTGALIADYGAAETIWEGEKAAIEPSRIQRDSGSDVSDQPNRLHFKHRCHETGRGEDPLSRADAGELRLRRDPGLESTELPPGRGGRYLNVQRGAGAQLWWSGSHRRRLSRTTHLTVPGRRCRQTASSQHVPHLGPKASPGFKADYYTLAGWLSAELFVQALRDAGTHPSQGAVLQALRSITSFSGNYMVGTGNPSAKKPTNCYILAKIENGAFQRLDDPPADGPTHGYRCDQPITTRPDAIPGSKTPPRRGRKRSVSRDWVQ